ncbi:chaperone NapD [Ferrimonas balearica]|uniref:chaperone NapD n=1 Tax=Ferrimonas balearica TaxID=44012 RepID=UPI001C55ECD9|nr:chaperone NapD [Ferrimonas balearica]MBW3140114.1 chaperone NapD [Ferrimonas balearica]MBW3165136.1 chaperone NapD [Ferrimonas balearica]MBY6106778.1 chaperone NapD [Ferrimonas balearica]MBY6224664.1 chaperone NapD [Ferrimonas balearica]
MSEQICSLVVNAAPDARPGVEANIEALAGASVALSDPSGKMVVLLEHPNQKTQVDCIDHIKGLPGVSATSLIYHQQLS